MKPKYGIILAAALALLAGLLPSLSCQNGSAAGDANPGTAAMSPEFAARLGQDDGFAISLLFGADVQGNLKDCGCPKHPQGGIAWRMGYAEGLKKLAPDAAIVQLDAGRMFANSVGYIQPYDRVRNEWMLRAYGEAGFAAANASYFDVQMLAELLHKPEFDTKRQTFPFLNRIVSANIRPTKPELTPLPAYIIETVQSKRLPKPVRLGITGVTMANPNPGAETLNFAIEDPAEALKRVLPELRTKADFVIVMSYGPEFKLTRSRKCRALISSLWPTTPGRCTFRCRRSTMFRSSMPFPRQSSSAICGFTTPRRGRSARCGFRCPALTRIFPRINAGSRWSLMPRKPLTRR
jgi:2',3'-cyclic-nucleotide 2'-phosphodiesterase (5'-nucleotidase family)